MIQSELSEANFARNGELVRWVCRFHLDVLTWSNLWLKRENVASIWTEVDGVFVWSTKSICDDVTLIFKSFLDREL